MVLGFDTETQLIRRGRLIPRFACLSLAGDGTAPAGLDRYARVDLDPASGMWRAVVTGDEAGIVLEDVMLQPETTLVAHNAAFDLAVLMRAFPDHTESLFAMVAEGRVLDTIVREKLIRIALGELTYRHAPDGSAVKMNYRLSDLVEFYLGIDISDEKSDPNAWRMRFGELELLPLEDWPLDAVTYAAQDSVYALQVARAQRIAIPSGEVGGFPVIVPGGPVGSMVVSEAREVAAALSLHLAAAWGMRLNPKHARDTIAKWESLSSAGRQAAIKAGWVRGPSAGKRAGSVDKKALQAAVRNALGPTTPVTKPSETFPSGQVKTDEETLILAAEYTNNPSLQAYAESVEYTGHLNRYRDLFLGLETDGHLYPITSRPDVLKETGRISWTDPNFTAPPREGGYRECFEPRPGHLLSSVDYEAIEIVAIAQICLWVGLGRKFAEAINEGRDLHSIMGAELRTADGRPTTYEDFRAAIKKGETMLEPGSNLLPASEYRQIGKHCNFGFLSGLGGAGFAGMVKKQSGIVIPNGDATRETWFATWPEARAYFGWVDAVAGNGVCQQFVSHRVRGDTRPTAAYNGYFQGLVADGAKYSLWLLTHAAHTGRMPPGVAGTDLALDAAARAYHGSRPILFLHDEIISEHPEDRASEASEGKARIMIWGMSRHIPDVAVRAEPALMRRWYKKAQTVRDADGRVITWEPKE